MYEYILFDFDGTLFDTLEGITKSVRYAINKQGFDAPLEDLRCFAGPPLVDMFMEKFGLSLPQAEQATADFRERYLPIGLYECRVFPGVKELLLSLRRAGKILAVATSKPQALAEELLAREGMLDYFSFIKGSRPDGNNSAKWEIVRQVMEALGAGADNCLLVGDTKYDVEGAHRCGIPCAAVGFGYAAEGELEKAGADFSAADCPALERLLLGK